MKYISLNEVIRSMYSNRVAYIQAKNIELEREYFSTHDIPMSEIMQEASFEDHFQSFKKVVKNGKEEEIEQVFILLRDYFLFSYGHDMMFKKKLEADIFTSTPMEDFIYPRLVEAVKEKYNDISVMEENPNRNKNMEGIDRIIYTYTEVQSLLYLLYWSDFQFPDGWEGICLDTHEEVIAILKSSGMTIGDFLQALIAWKCQIMNEILKEIDNPTVRQVYLKKVADLKGEKEEETKTFTHVDLPITYFLDHTFLDFLERKPKSAILDDTTPKGAVKIYLPK